MYNIFYNVGIYNLIIVICTFARYILDNRSVVDLSKTFALIKYTT